MQCFYSGWLAMFIPVSVLEGADSYLNKHGKMVSYNQKSLAICFSVMSYHAVLAVLASV